VASAVRRTPPSHAWTRVQIAARHGLELAVLAKPEGSMDGGIELTQVAFTLSNQTKGNSCFNRNIFRQ
jgi:hypothetical protein